MDMNGPQHEQEHFCLTPMLMCFVLFVSHVPQHIPEATSCPSSLEVADPRLDTRGGPEQQGCMSFAQASQKGGVLYLNRWCFEGFGHATEASTLKSSTWSG